jgi:hypothetical protein
MGAPRSGRGPHHLTGMRPPNPPPGRGNEVLHLLTWNVCGMQFITGQVIEPKILGNAMDIPPITVICALLFWGSLWGIIGAILSVRSPSPSHL